MKFWGFCNRFFFKVWKIRKSQILSCFLASVFAYRKWRKFLAFVMKSAVYCKNANKKEEQEWNRKKVKGKLHLVTFFWSFTRVISTFLRVGNPRCIKERSRELWLIENPVWEPLVSSGSSQVLHKKFMPFRTKTTRRKGAAELSKALKLHHSNFRSNGFYRPVMLL